MERLRLEKMVHGGAALARLANGRVALVYGGIPGELVEVSLAERSRVLQGSVERVLEASPLRVPASEHPGLDYSHVAYEGQLELKCAVVADSLERSLKQAIEVPVPVPSPQQWHYRHTVQPAVGKDGLGYRQPQSHEVKVLVQDASAHETINHLWQRLRAGQKGLREIAFRCNDAGDLLLCLIASASARNFVPFAHDLLELGVTGVSYAPFDSRGRFRSGSERLAGKRSIEQQYGDFVINVSATSFAQPNPAAASLLYDELRRWAGEGKTALDLYAGSGVIGFHLAKKFDEVLAYELDRSSVVRGERDAGRLGLNNVKFSKIDAKRLEALPDAELITVDPPRAGLAKTVRETIIDSTASRIIYVACDVATWARDVAHFLGAGFRLEKLQPYDFYPQTHHIEMLSLLER